MAFKFNPFTGSFDNVINPSAIAGNVSTFADLPNAASNANRIYNVLTSTGVIFVNRRKAGLYKSDGTNWNYFTSFTAAQVDFDDTSIPTITATSVQAAVESHANNVTNPHSVDSNQVGLGNVDNTSDADKPVSISQQTALNLKYDASNPNGYQTAAQVQSTADTAAGDSEVVSGTFSIVGGNITLNKGDGSNVIISTASLSGNLSNIEDDIADLQSFNSGAGALADSLGFFPGSTISNNIGVKDAFLEVEAAIEDRATQTALDALQVELNTEKTRTSLIAHSGRFYCYVDLRWVTNSDDNYGNAYYQYLENCGTGADPIYEWEHNGDIIPAGKTIKNLLLQGRTTSTEVTDLEIIVVERKPNPIARHQSGYDNDGEMTNTVLYRDTWKNAVGSFTGNTNDMHLANIPLNHTFTENAMISIYMRPVGTLTADRHFLSTYTWEIY